MFFGLLASQSARREAHDAAEHAISEHGRGAIKYLSRQMLMTQDDHLKEVLRLAVRDAMKMHSWSAET